MAEELLVELSRSENSGFGFSLLGQQGLPHIIYAISEDSPAAESGKVQVGDVILKVNETDVINFNTKEVLKCLRLSSDPVTLKIKRDPNVKATFQKQLLSGSGDDGDVIALHHPRAGSNNYNQGRPEPAVHRTNGSCPEQQPLLAQENDRLYWQPLEEKPKAPKFEAFMMTGDKMLNISKTQQSILPKQQLKKVDHARFHNSHAHHLRHQQHNSVPNSPNEMDMGLRGNHRSSGPNSANTSPISANKRDSNPSPSDKTFNNFVRTSRSEDQLQDTKSMSAVDIDVDDDITSSLNTLLDTRPDAGSSSNVCTSSNSDRIVWTYNAPVTTSAEQNKLCQTLSNGSSSSPTSSSPLRSTSPQSPTSVSSSVMSSHSGSARKLPYTLTNGPHTDSGQYNQTNGGDFSVSEAISNISSPDYHDDDSMGIRDYVMEISDHSDSDSTLLVSEPRQRLGSDGDHRIVIQVKGPDKEQQSTVKDRGKQSTNKINNKDQPTFDQQTCYYGMELTDVVEDVWPPPSEDDSDLESLHSFHLTPKAVDMPSAIRLANRLYNLDGFKKSDVSRHLSKNNEFSRAVADEYLKNFNFYKDILDFALRKFLKQFSLTGETQERERVLVHFSKRYLDCNPGSFNSQDAVHTLTCAIMLLNTDLHGQSMSRKMTCSEFIENLAGLNEGENFPKDVLKELYNAIKSNPLEWALDEENEDNVQMQLKPIDSNIGGNPFLDVPSLTNAIEYKKGYVMRKCCYETNGKRSLCCIFLAPFHKRSWKMFHCTLRDLVLYLHKDENGFRKNQMSDNLHNAIRIHHALATKATDYTKKQYVFRLQTADQAEYLFQTSDLKELQSWIDTINFVCASFSAPPLEAAVGSQKKFQRPLLPCSHTKFNLREQLLDHEERVTRLERDLMEHQQMPPERGSKSLVIQNYKEREAYLSYELKRYKTYAYILRSRMAPQYQELGVSLVETAIGELDEATGGAVTYLDGGGAVVAPPIPDRPSPQTNRYSYRQAIYSRHMINGDADIG